MNRSALLLILLASLSASAATENPAYLCIVVHSTGFVYDDEQKEWEAATFKGGEKYFISKPDKYGIREIKEVGKTTALMSCSQGFNENGSLFCGTGTSFNMNRHNLRFLHVFPVGYWNDGIPLKDGLQIKDGELTPYMSIGKCIPLD
jgi:hypothetical protein